MAPKAGSQKQTGNISEEQQRQIEEDVRKEIEAKQEAAKAAERAQYCKKKAKELADAAKGAGDPDERQKLLNEALEKEVEAETFGKTAKYLQSGAFQGMLAGTGLGGGIGIWLGIVTGTLVGGTTGTLTGGIGAGIGLGIGAIHGPFVKIGHLMGNTLRKITGDIPGWKATKEQKAALEKMIYGVQEQEVPTDDELETIRADGAGKQEKASNKQKQSSTSNMSFQSSMPSVPSMSGGGSGKTGQNAGQAKMQAARSKPTNASRNLQAQAEEQMKEQMAPEEQVKAIQRKVQAGQAVNSEAAQMKSQGSASAAKPNSTNRTSQRNAVPTASGEGNKAQAQPAGRNTPSTSSRKPNESNNTKAATQGADEATKKKPRKLEVRSANANGSPTSKRTTRASG